MRLSKACGFMLMGVCVGARVYFLQYIFHNYSDAKGIETLKNLAVSMKPSYSRILISNHILPNTGCSVRSAEMDLGMLYLHGGMQRSESQWTRLVEEAGLKVAKFWHPPGEHEGIIEVVLKDLKVTEIY
jgi:hypothetical protein